MSRIVIAGGDSSIGRALARAFEEDGHDVVTTTRNRADVTERRLLLDLAEPSERWPSLDADAAFLCAAVTSVAACEADPIGSGLINVRASAELVRRLHAAGAFVTLLSTSLVFDGARDDYAPGDATSPQTEYGKQKAELERRARSITGERACVVRLGKVVGPDVALFRGWRAALEAGLPIGAYDDAKIAPLSLATVVALLRLVETRRTSGIFQLTSADEMTFRSAALELAALLRVSPDLVRAASSGSPPRHATLDSQAVARAFGIEAPPAAGVMRAALPIGDARASF